MQCLKPRISDKIDDNRARLRKEQPRRDAGSRYETGIDFARRDYLSKIIIELNEQVRERASFIDEDLVIIKFFRGDSLTI